MPNVIKNSRRILQDAARLSGVVVVTILSILTITIELSPIQFGYRIAEAATTVIDSDTTLTDYTVSAGDRLVINSGVKIYFSGTTTNNGEIINNGFIGFTDFPSTFDNNGIVDNKGSILNDAAEITNYGTFSNDGSINNGLTFTNEDTLNNQGTIDNEYDMDNNGIIENSGGISTSSVAVGFGNSGTINIHDSGSLGTITNYGTINNFGRLFSDRSNSGIINNYGTFEVVEYINYGTINNYGTIDILFGNLDNEGTVNNYCGGIINVSEKTRITGNPVNELCDETDADADGVKDEDDNCPKVSNPNQADLDGDGIGDVCDEHNAVAIEIKPGDDELSAINLGSKGHVTVAIWGTDDFDVSEINTSTVDFEGAQPTSSTDTKFEDVNNDGIKDLILKFETHNISSLEEGDTEGCLTGELNDGDPTQFEGCDEIKVID